MEKYKLQMDFRPSFKRHSSWIASCSGRKAKLVVVVKEGADGGGLKRNFSISAEQAKKLLEVGQQTLAHYSKSWGTFGLDGITVEGSFKSETFSLDEFFFWSPAKGSHPHQLVAALFDLVPLDDVDEEFMSYYKELTSYF